MGNKQKGKKKNENLGTEVCPSFSIFHFPSPLVLMEFCFLPEVTSTSGLYIFSSLSRASPHHEVKHATVLQNNYRKRKEKKERENEKDIKLGFFLN